MKFWTSIVLAFLVTSSFGAFDQVSLENAAAKELKIENLETFDWKVELGPIADVVNVEFTYDQEFFDTTLDIVTFSCSGTVVNSTSPVFTSLTCVEEEPMLWEE